MTTTRTNTMTKTIKSKMDTTNNKKWARVLSDYGLRFRFKGYGGFGLRLENEG